MSRFSPFSNTRYDSVPTSRCPVTAIHRYGSVDRPDLCAINVCLSICLAGNHEKLCNGFVLTITCRFRKKAAKPHEQMLSCDLLFEQMPCVCLIQLICFLMIFFAPSHANFKRIKYRQTSGTVVLRPLL